MPAFSAEDLLQAWEAGLERDPVDRPLRILSTAPAGMPEEMGATLTVGQRDAALLRLREQAFGPDIAAWAECPRCGERVEWSFRTKAILLPAPDQECVTHELSWQDMNISFRLPNSHDLAMIADCADIPAARFQLLSRCVLAVDRRGELVPTQALSTEAVDALSQAMSVADPQAEVLFDLRCPACTLSWQIPFDIASFLWVELSAAAGRLLREVHVLARAYGWREADILAISPERRRSYLEMVS